MWHRRAYPLLIGTCLGLFVLAWAVIRPVSVTGAIIVGVVAALIPLVVVTVANYSSWDDEGRGSDEPLWGSDVEDDQAP
ncbi:MAG: DUF3099 domain-containing protein [Actinomycetes bacterium]